MGPLTANADGGHSLHYCALFGYPERIQALLEGGVPPNLLEDDIRPALADACDGGQFECARVLLEAGADPNLSHPLTLACRFGSISLVQLLLEHGARPQPEALEAARARLGQPLPEGTDGPVQLRRVRNSRGEAEVHYSWSNRSMLSVQGEGHSAIVALLEAFSGGSQ